MGGKPVKTNVVAGAAILFLFCCNSVWAQWPVETYGTRPGWEMEVGARILDRPGSDMNIPLVSDGITLQTLFTDNNATDLDVSGGADFRVQKLGCYDSTWEIRGYYNNWDIVETRNGTLSAPAFEPPGLPVMTRLTAFDYTYESQLFNLEWNFKRAIQPGLTLFLGPRYMDLRERSNINGNFFNPAPALQNFLQTRTPTETKNHLIGLNLGAEFRRPISRDLFVVAFIKGGVFYNDAKARIQTEQTLFGFPTGISTLLDDRKGTSAGVGELSVRVHYDIAPGTVSVFAGYEAMWLDGVATAPAQLFTVVGPPAPLVVETGTTIFAHGLTIGGMVRF